MQSVQPLTAQVGPLSEPDGAEKAMDKGGAAIVTAFFTGLVLIGTKISEGMGKGLKRILLFMATLACAVLTWHLAWYGVESWADPGHQRALGQAIGAAHRASDQLNRRIPDPPPDH